MSPTPSLRILQAAALAGCALATVAAFLPGVRLWGVGHLAFYPPVVRFAAIALFVLSFVPPIARAVYAGLLSLSRRLKDGGQTVEVALVVIAVLSSVVFAGLSASTSLLGDGQLVADTIHRAVESGDLAGAVGADRVETGTNLLYYQAAKLAAGRFGKSPVDGIRFLNCILGTIFIYIFLGLLRQGDFPPATRLWFLVLSLFSGTMELFFGYIEYYTPLVFLLFLYVLNSMLVLRGRGRWWVSVLLLLLAGAAHVQALVFVPSLLFLIAHTRAGPHGEGRVATLLAALTLVGAVVIGLLPRFHGYYLPLLSTAETPGLLSIAHWVDVVNELLLLMPALPVVVAALWIGGRRVSAAGSKAGPWFSSPSERRFVLLVVFSCLLYLVVFKPGIGLVRDWDLFAMASLGLVPLALPALDRVTKRLEDPLDAATFAIPAVVTTVVLTSAWIGVNASPDRSAARFESMFEYDRVHAPYAYENLAAYYRQSGDLARAIERLEAAVEISGNPRQRLALAMYQEENGDTRAAREQLTRILASRPEYGDARVLLLAILDAEGQYADLHTVANQGLEYDATNPQFWFHLGQSSIALGSVDEGVDALRRCLELGAPAELQDRARELLGRHQAGN
jgi:hypothetical protein